MGKSVRLAELKRALQAHGVELHKPTSGSHWKFKKQGFGTVPVPLKKGERSMVPPEYVKNICESFGIKEDDLRASL